MRFGFPIPLTDQAWASKPISAPWYEPDPEDWEELTNPAKEEGRRVTRSPTQAGLSPDDIWAAGSFVVQKRLFTEILSSKKRTVVDFSRTINPFVPDWPFHLPSIPEVLADVLPDGLIGVIDISSAFMAVPINPKYWHFLGSRRGPNHTLVYTSLPLGLRCSPALFSMISAEIVLALRANGLRAHVYIDDVLLHLSSPEEYGRAADIIEEFGFPLARDKLSGPARAVTYLGVRIDLDRNLISIPGEKATTLLKILRAAKQVKRDFSQKEMLSLAGRLSWVGSILPLAGAFAKGIFEWAHLDSTIREQGRSSPSLFSRRSPARLDALWWERKLATATDKDYPSLLCSPLHPGRDYLSHVARPSAEAISWCSDASIKAIGLVLFDEAYVLRVHTLPGGRFGVKPSLDSTGRMSDAINALELLGALLPLFLACRGDEWGDNIAKRLANAPLLAITDNAGVAAMINKGRSSSRLCSRLLRFGAIALERLNSRLVAQWTPREDNAIADFLSKLI
jgi:hypothetical protein